MNIECAVSPGLLRCVPRVAPQRHSELLRPLP